MKDLAIDVLFWITMNEVYVIHRAGPRRRVGPGAGPLRYLRSSVI